MSLVLILHIFLAILSLILTTVLIFKPSAKKINATFGLFLATLATGTYMIFTMKVNILMTCIEGLLFMAFVVGGIAIARKRLIKQTANKPLE